MCVRRGVSENLAPRHCCDWVVARSCLSTPPRPGVWRGVGLSLPSRLRKLASSPGRPSSGCARSREKAVPRLQRLTCATTTSSPFPSPAVPHPPPPFPFPRSPPPPPPLNRPCRPQGRLPQAGAVAAATGRHPSLPARTCRASCAGDP